MSTRDKAQSSNGASPQGYTPVPNEVFTLAAVLNGSEAKALLWLIRETLGWEEQDSKARRTKITVGERFAARSAGISRNSMESAFDALREIGAIRISGESKRRRTYEIDVYWLKNCASSWLKNEATDWLTKRATSKKEVKKSSSKKEEFASPPTPSPQRKRPSRQPQQKPEPKTRISQAVDDDDPNKGGPNKDQTPRDLAEELAAKHGGAERALKVRFEQQSGHELPTPALFRISENLSMRGREMIDLLEFILREGHNFTSRGRGGSADNPVGLLTKLSKQITRSYDAIPSVPLNGVVDTWKKKCQNPDCNDGKLATGGYCDCKAGKLRAEVDARSAQRVAESAA